MTKEAAIEQTIIGLLSELRPEIDLATVPSDAELRDELDLDSIDVLNLMVAIDEALGIDVPEEDYAEFATLDGCVAYLATRAGEGA